MTSALQSVSNKISLRSWIDLRLAMEAAYGVGKTRKFFFHG